MTTFAIPHPDPESAEQQVENGLALLEFNGWSRNEIRDNVLEDFELFDITDTCNCIVGRTIGWAAHDDALMGYDQGLSPLATDELFGFDGGNFRNLQAAWLELLGIDENGES